MARFRFAAGLVLLGAGGFLAAYGLFLGGGNDTAPATSNRYLERAPCENCPVAIDSAEVQSREGSTLFVFGGGWPGAIGDIPGDLRLSADDLDVTLRPNADAGAFEILGRGIQPESIAVGLQDGALLIDLADGVVSAPIRFAVGLVDDDGYTARLPREGLLEWTGSGAPHRVSEEPSEPEAPPEEEPDGETPEAFADALGAAFREGDTPFLLDRLNPAVTDLYGSGQCRRYLSDQQDPTREFDVRRVSELEPYDYDPDGRSIAIEEAYSLVVNITIDGETSRSEVHFAPVGDVLTWFTDCGRPSA
jgi:hypothetical protein